MKQLMLLLGVFCLSFSLSAQCEITVNSTDGYSVDISLQPVSIDVKGNCESGYNFNVNIDYAISFSGSNIPKKLWTLQGNLGCVGFANSFFHLPNKGGSGTTKTIGNVWNPNSDCATATVESLGCNTVYLEIEGPGIPAQVIECNVPLPVELLYFSTSVNDNAVAINWATATETNNDYFSVERSSDGTHWVEIEIVIGQGDSVEEVEYGTTDPSPLVGISYYRLKQTDYDEAFSFSSVEVVEFVAPQVHRQLHLYPNPAIDYVILEGDDIALRQISIFDLAGRRVQQASGSLLLSETSVRLDVSHLPKGLYIISDGKAQQKLSKL